MLKFSEMGVNIVMDVIGGVPLIQQFVKITGNPNNINGLVFLDFLT